MRYATERTEIFDRPGRRVWTLSGLSGRRDTDESPLARVMFAPRCKGNKVRVNNGDILWGDEYIEVLGDWMTITADGSYIGVELDFYERFAHMIGPSVDLGVFRPDATTYRTWLCQIGLRNGAAYVQRIRTLGGITLQSWYGGDVPV